MIFCCHFFFQPWFYLVKLVTIANGTSSVSLEVYFLSGLQQFTVFYSFISALLFILILIAHVWVCLRHMSSECLCLLILFITYGTNVLILSLFEILRSSTHFFESLRFGLMRYRGFFIFRARASPVFFLFGLGVGKFRGLRVKARILWPFLLISNTLIDILLRISWLIFYLKIAYILSITLWRSLLWLILAILVTTDNFWR